jgi:hypothetical protein
LRIECVQSKTPLGEFFRSDAGKRGLHGPTLTQVVAQFLQQILEQLAPEEPLDIYFGFWKFVSGNF